MMNLKQTKLVGLAMELELKTREYKKLCDELENLKENNINPNDEQLLKLKQLFQKNHKEIVEINQQIKNIKQLEEPEIEQYDPEKLFKKNNDTQKEEKSLTVIDNNKSIFAKILEKIKKWFSRNKRS